MKEVNLNEVVTPLLKKKGMTKRDLAFAIGVTPGNLLKYLQNPTLKNLLAIADVLGCSLDELCGLSSPQRVAAPNSEMVVVEIGGVRYKLVPME